MAQRVSSTTTDRETIRRWVEERGGWPAAVEGTSRGEEDTGIIRIDFPGFSGEGKLRRISWDDWFEKFDESGLAFVYEETTASGERSNFNKLVSRETAAAASGGGRRRSQGTARGGRARGTSRARSRAGAQAKRAGGRRQASRAEAARTTRRGAAGKRSAQSRGQSSRGGGRAKKGARTSGRGAGRGGSRGGRTRQR